MQQLRVSSKARGQLQFGYYQSRVETYTLINSDDPVVISWNSLLSFNLGSCSGLTGGQRQRSPGRDLTAPISKCWSAVALVGPTVLSSMDQQGAYTGLTLKRTNWKAATLM